MLLDDEGLHMSCVILYTHINSPLVPVIVQVKVSHQNIGHHIGIQIP